MLEHQYRKQFGMYIELIETCDVARVGTLDFSHIDYVFTTVPLNVKLPCARPPGGRFLLGDERCQRYPQGADVTLRNRTP